MKVSKIIERRIRRNRAGVDFAADVNAVIAANVGESGSPTSVSSHQKVVQRSDKTPNSNAQEARRDQRT